MEVPEVEAFDLLWPFSRLAAAPQDPNRKQYDVQMPTDPSLDLPELSEIIGAIYDCAIEPAGWTDVLRRISGLLDAFTSAIYLVDLDAGQARLFSQWGMPEEAARQWQSEFADEVAGLHSRIANRLGPDADEPIVYSQLFDEIERSATRVDREWAQPLGVCDVVAAVVSTTARRVGFLAANRQESVGLVTSREVAIMRLLAPHVRQAVRIGDLLDMRRLTAGALASTLDALTTGVVIVGANSQILHANASAQRMMRDGGPLRSVDGALRPAGERPGPNFAQSFTRLASSSDRVSKPVHVTLPHHPPTGEAPAIAVVLALDSGEVRSRLAPDALAAVFVTEASGINTRQLDALAASWQLSAAERRLLAPMARGLGVEEAAAEIGISVNTVKSQLQQLFKRFGVSRQADLVALVHRSLPPLALRSRSHQTPE